VSPPTTLGVQVKSANSPNTYYFRPYTSAELEHREFRTALVEAGVKVYRYRPDKGRSTKWSWTLQHAVSGGGWELLDANECGPRFPAYWHRAGYISEERQFIYYSLEERGMRAPFRIR